MKKGRNSFVRSEKEPQPDKAGLTSTNYWHNRKSPIRIVLVIFLTVFFGELAERFIMHLLPKMPPIIEGLLDPFLMIAMVSPVLYFGLFRSLVKQIEKRQELVRELEKHRNKLEELVDERTSDLGESNQMLNREIKVREAVEKQIIENTRQLSERVKELNCLYSISSLLVTPDLTLPEMLQRAVELIPRGMHSPNKACARIQIEHQEFKTPNYTETEWKLTSQIDGCGELLGELQVCYLQDRLKPAEAVFLKEETDLVHSVAVQLGNAICNKR